MLLGTSNIKQKQHQDGVNGQEIFVSKSIEMTLYLTEIFSLEHRMRIIITGVGWIPSLLGIVNVTIENYV